VTARALVVTGLLVTLVPSIAMAAPAARGKTKATQTADPATDTRDRAPAPKSSAKIEHAVQRGETLGAIAKKYKVTVASLVIANRLRGPRAKLQAGQRLVVVLRPGVAPTVRARRGPVDEPLPVSLVLGVPDFEDAPSFQWPVTGPVSSTFGRRSRTWHRGVDILAEPGTPIVASAAGVVIASGFEPRYGQRVKIEHEGGFVTLYAHNERNLVEVGQEVLTGQVIAVVGRTGRATAEHVHFEIRYDGRVYNPLYLLPLPPRSVRVELAAIDPHDSDD
jgi:murein DD-endopeptidase MepM/ murein hydrolase activator NlpD